MSNDSQDEIRWQFRGGWISAQLFNYLRDGEMSKTDLLLGIIIDSLVTTGGKGCYASNNTLARLLGKSSHHISGSIQRLEKLGLVRIYYQANQRYLEMCWSRIGETETKFKKFKKDSVQTHKGGTEKSVGGTEKQTIEGTEKSVPYIKTGIKSDHCRESATTRSARSAAFRDGENSSVDHTLSKKLFDGLTRLGLITTKPRLQAWIKEFFDLRKYKSLIRIEEVLDWYLTNIRQPFVPQAYSAKSFKVKFTAIEASMERLQQAAETKAKSNKREVW